MISLIEVSKLADDVKRRLTENVIKAREKLNLGLVRYHQDSSARKSGRRLER